ncbi:hypothetical protein D3C87_1063550 [compost metagenome]
MALVRITPRIGPAQGAQSSPVATPIMIDASGPDLLREFGSMRLPSNTKGRASQSPTRAEISDRANSTITTSATWRPVLLAWITHSLLTTARLETRAKVRTMPPRVSRIEERVRSAPANRKGTTGRMHGLRTVNMPPRKAMSNMGSPNTH